MPFSLTVIVSSYFPVFTTIRVYAISGRNFSLAVITLLLAMVLPLAQLVRDSSQVTIIHTDITRHARFIKHRND